MAIADRDHVGSNAVKKTEGRTKRVGFLVSRSRRAVGLVALALLLTAVSAASLSIGSAPTPATAVWPALTDFDGSNDHIIVRDMRLPRTLIGLAVGAALGVAGGLMQAITRNPLAEPGILGVNAGAAFAIVTAVYVFGAVTPLGYVWFAFFGAAAAVTIVYLLGTMAGSKATPVTLALAGVVVTLLLDSWITLILVFNERTLDEVRFWLAGSLAGRGLEEMTFLVPFLVIALIAGLLLARQLNTLSLGEDVARSLGARTGRVRLISAIVVVILAGSAVAAAGPIGFVGLAVPHIARSLAGADYRWIQSYALLLGPTLLVGADVLGRVLARPGEVQVGIITALLGAPLLIALARRKKLVST